MTICNIRHLPPLLISGIVLVLVACGADPNKVNDNPVTLNLPATQRITFANRVIDAQVFGQSNRTPSSILIVAQSDEGDKLELLSSDEHGVLKVENSYHLGFSASKMFTFDLNDDSLSDAVLLTPSSVYVRLSVDETSFTPTSQQIGLADVTAMDIGYFDNNKTGDMALLSNQSLHILTSDSTGRFLPGNVYSTSAAGVRTGDFNSDGITDLILHQGRTLETRVGHGDGSFSLLHSSPTDIQGTDDIHVGDVNADGWPDVLLVSPTGSGGGNLNVLLNNQDGSFQSLLHLNYQNELDVNMFYTDQAVLIDANCDQMDDLAILEFDTQTVKVLISTGETFENAVTITEPYTDSFPNTGLFATAGRNDTVITAVTYAPDNETELKTYRNPDC